MSKESAIFERQAIPGVGRAIAEDLFSLGIHCVGELNGADPGALYKNLCVRQGPVDRCMLYVFRCGVYYASTLEPDPERLKWWALKD